MRPTVRILLLAVFMAGIPLSQSQAADPLPSWNEGAAKQAILSFVQKVTQPGKDYVRPEERIATFDNDGTLWVEQPLYFQLIFMLGQVKAAAPKHPEWKQNPAFQAVEKNDYPALAAMGHQPVLELVAAANTGMSTEEYEKTVRNWIDTAKDSRFKKLYKDLTYRPMKELMTYLRANGFKTFIVSGGGVEFMRPWTEQVYGVPPEQVVGSSVVLKYEFANGKPVLIREPKIFFIDDKGGKPVGIQQFIGRRPIAAFGNSDGDQQMLEWTAARDGASLMILVHHDDAEREYAYDRQSKIGTLDKAWDEALARGWSVISMKNDWKQIF